MNAEERKAEIQLIREKLERLEMHFDQLSWKAVDSKMLQQINKRMKKLEAELEELLDFAEPEFVDIDVDSLCLENVDYDATLIYGAFGAVHEDEGPLDWADLRSQPSFYDSVNNY